LFKGFLNGIYLPAGALQGATAVFYDHPSPLFFRMTSFRSIHWILATSLAVSPWALHASESARTASDERR